MKPPVPTALAVACLLAACAGAPPLPQPAVDAPLAFHAAPAAPATEASPADWWQVFADPELDDLVARASQHHPRLAQAEARLAQAQSLAATTAAGARPQLAAQASATRQGGPLVNAAGRSGTLLGASLSASASADLGGRAASVAEAAQLDALAAASLLRATRLQVQAEVAQALLTLRARDAEIALQRDAVAGWREALRITEARQRLGGLAEAAVWRVRTELAQAEADALALAQRRATALAALTEAAGAAAGQVVVDERPWPARPPQPPAGLPAAMLARRGDVAATQQRLQAALLRLGAAQSAWMPELTLGASAGQASSSLAQLLSASVRAWSLGVALAVPVIDGGRRDAARQQARADLDLALAEHRSAVFTACHEVEAQLVLLQGLADGEGARRQAVDAAARQLEALRRRQASGGASAAEVVDAERGWLQARRQLLQLDAEQRQAQLALVRALGGGWGDAAPQRAGEGLQAAAGS